MRSTVTNPLLLAASVIALSSCSLQKISTSAERTAFLKSTGVKSTEKLDRLPFDHSWRDSSADFSGYHNILVRPVSTSHLRRSQWKDSFSTFIPTEAAYAKECGALAGRFTSMLKSSFSSGESSYRSVSDTSKAGTLVLEVAITEVTFGRPAGYVGALAVPGGSIANAAAASPVVAFEARIKDARTGRLLATAADRRGTKLKLIDINQLTYTKANDEICREWSVQLMQAGNEDLFPKVKRSYFSPF